MQRRARQADPLERELFDGEVTPPKRWVESGGPYVSQIDDEFECVSRGGQQPKPMAGLRDLLSASNVESDARVRTGAPLQTKPYQSLRQRGFDAERGIGADAFPLVFAIPRWAQILERRQIRSIRWLCKFV